MCKSEEKEETAEGKIFVCYYVRMYVICYQCACIRDNYIQHNSYSTYVCTHACTYVRTHTHTSSPHQVVVAVEEEAGVQPLGEGGPGHYSLPCL